MTIAYLILAHAHPRQTRRLVAALPAGSPVFVHVDKRAGADMLRAFGHALADRPGVTLVPSHVCYWGGIGIVRATVELIHAAHRSDRPFTHATLLSGADYPIKPDRAIADTLARAPDRQFIESFPLAEPNRWSDQGGLFRAPDRVLRFHLRVRSRVVATPWRRALPHGLVPRGGSQWWTLTRPALAFISDYLAAHPRVMRFMAHAFIPDESLVQTVLGASPFADRVAGTDLRLVVWDRPEPPYPATLGRDDLPLMAASPALFARKFAADNPAVLDLVDARLRRVGPAAGAC